MQRFLRTSFTILAAALVFWTGAVWPFEPLRIQKQNGERLAFTVEIADTPEAQRRGLMYRDHLPEDQGMLFVYRAPVFVSFWMKNTQIPLDLIFIAQDGKITGIKNMARPYDESPIPSGAPVKAVLEIKGGLAERLGITKGDRVMWSQSDLQNGR